MSFGQRQTLLLSLPSMENEATDELLNQLESLKIPENFAQTAQGFREGDQRNRRKMPRVDLRNPQTEQFLQMLQIPYNLHYGGQRSTAPAVVDSRDESHTKARDLEASFITFDADES